MKTNKRFSELAKRYAASIYEIAVENKLENDYHAQLKKVAELFNQDNAIKAFCVSPLIKASEKEAAVKKAIEGGGLADSIASLLLLLAQRERLALLDEIVAAFEARNDERSGITRGEVSSVVALSAEQKQEIENIVGQATRKKVVLNFKEDKNIVGGVVAQVGSLSFDDSLASHLRRIEENLNRRTN
jgi:F-type H+-transporting ATPase subunit delta